MKSVIERFTILTRRETELINITESVRAAVAHAEVRSGTVFVLSLHTTTGITVNEGLPDIEADIAELLARLAPESRTYHHGRFLAADGQMGVNAVSHLRSALLGFEVFFPIVEAEIVLGGRQNIYLVELDGPQERSYVVQCLGDSEPAQRRPAGKSAATRTVRP